MTQLGLTDGRAERDAALNHFESHYRSTAFVDEARRTAFSIAKRQGYVSTDDLHEVFEPPASIHWNVWGSVLRAPYFVHVGQIQSKRPEAHARWIHKWAVGPEWRKYLG